MLLPRLKNDNVPELKLNDLQYKMKDEVDRKVKDGSYQFEEITCPICESDDKETVGEKDRYGLFMKTNLCVNCGLVYTSPRMKQSAYNEFYNVEYRKLYVGKETATSKFFDNQMIKGKLIYKYLEKYNLISNRPLNVFEVGCGAGGILDVFREKGHDVKGIDLGREYLEYGREVHNLDLEVGMLSDYKFEKKCDVLIYSHVLEHILTVNEELEAIKNVVDENTLIYIEVPGVKEVHKNYEFNFLTYFQNAHTYHFTLETLTNLFVKNGFELVNGNQFVQSVFKYTGKPSAISSDYIPSKNYILETESKLKYYPYRRKAISKALRNAVHKILDITKTRKIARSMRLKFTNKK